MPNFDQKDFNDMMELQRALANVLKRANAEKMNVVLAIFALIRLSRELLNQMPENERNVTLGQLVLPFLQGEEVKDEATRIITLH